MKKHIIAVSKQNLTRCASCSRHHKLDVNLSSDELLELLCDFCGGSLIRLPNQSMTTSPFSRSSKLALGLLSASLAFGGCDDEDEVIEQNAGTEMMIAGDQITQPVYGAPGGEVTSAGEDVEAGMEMAGMGIDQPVYGAPAAGEDVPVAGVEMEVAGEDIPQEAYGAPAAGAEE